MRVPDHYDFWEARDREQNRRLKELPMCADCGESIQEEEAYYINDEWICIDCMESYKKEVAIYEIS